MGVVILLIGLIACIIPIAIVVVIVSAIVKKSKESKSNFDEIIRSIYIYIILIVTLVAIVSGTIMTFRVGLDVLLPEKSTYQSSYTNDEMEKNENIIELFTTLSLVLSSIPVYLYHSKLTKKENKIEEINS